MCAVDGRPLFVGCLLLQQAEWVENICTGLCLVTIFMSIIVGGKQLRAVAVRALWPGFQLQLLRRLSPTHFFCRVMCCAAL